MSIRVYFLGVSSPSLCVFAYLCHFGHSPSRLCDVKHEIGKHRGPVDRYASSTPKSSTSAATKSTQGAIIVKLTLDRICLTTHRYTLMCPVAGVELHVWCAGMRTGNPREFITLGSEGNSANYMCGPSCRQRHPTSATVITKCVVCRTLSTSFKFMIVFSCNSHSVVFDDSAIKRWFFMQLIGPFFFSQSTSLNILMMRMILTSFA